MKLFGYRKSELTEVDLKPSELAEVSLWANPGEIRKIASFLLLAADEMERMGSAYSHIHLSAKRSGFDTSPHFTVFNSES